MEKLFISAIVVTCNEESLIRNCLSSLYFCDEVMVIDLESEDNSARIAYEMGANTVIQPRAPFVEISQHWARDKVKYDWILYIDPDEVVDRSLAKDIGEVLLNIKSDIGIIKLPWQFYFKNKLLKGTVWGDDNYKDGILVNRNKVIIRPTSQVKAKLKNGFKNYKIKRNGMNVIHHYWMRDYESLFEKHKRYIQVERKKKYDAGIRYELNRQIAESLRSFYYSFIIKKGYKDGYVGIFLSIFWAWYTYMGWASLKDYS